MNPRLITGLLTCLFFIAALQASAQKPMPIDSLAAHVGEDVTVCSKVFGVSTTKGEKPLTSLSLGAESPNQKLTVIIFQKTMARISGNPKEHFAQKDVCVTGTIQLYHDKLQIVAVRPDQIKISVN